MPGSVVNHLLLTRYENLLKELYVEPKDEQIIGTFLSASNETLGEIAAPPQPRTNRGKERKKEDKSKDIREMFSRPTRPQKKNQNSNATIVID